MKKKFYFFILAACLISLLFFSKTLMQHAFIWYAKNYCKECLGGELNFDTIYQKNDQWVIEKPSIQPAQDGGHAFRAEMVSVVPSLSWKDMKLLLEIEVTDPKLTIGPDAASIQQFFSQDRRELPFLTIDFKLSVSKGEVAIHDLRQPLIFGVDINTQDKNTTGSFTLHFDRHSTEQNFLKATLSHQAHLAFNQVNFSDAAKILKLIWPELKGWNVSSGVIHGDLFLDLSQERLILTKGEATFRQLSLQNAFLKAKADFPEVRLNIENAEGHLAMPAKGSVFFFKNDRPEWHIDNISLDILFNESDEAKIAFDGICRHLGKERSIHGEGVATLAEDNQTAVNLGIQLTGPAVKDFSAQFSARQLGDFWNFAEVNLVNFGVDEFNFFQNLLESSFPEFNQIMLYQGLLDATLLIYFDQFAVSELKMKNIAAKNLIADLDVWDISLDIKEGKGNLELDFNSHNIIDSLNGDIYISHGNLTVKEEKREKWKFSEIFADLAIRNGIPQKSKIQVTFAGLKGALDVDWGNSQQFVKVAFSGKTFDLANLLPESLREGIYKKFDNEKAEILAVASHKESPIIDGRILIGGDHEMAFGFNLEKVAAPEVMNTILPLLAMPALILQGDWLKSELPHSGITLRNGWFKAKKLSLSKCIAPFLFPADEATLKGDVDLIGAFDHKGIVLHYQTRKFILENPYFTIELNHPSSPHAQEEFSCTHYFDFENNDSYGTISVLNGTYLEKNSGLLFTDINGKFNINRNSLQVSDLETFCKGVYFAGTIDVKWQEEAEKGNDVDVHVLTMNGKVSQLQDLFGHFNSQHFFLKMPLEGNVSLDRQGGFLHFSFLPTHYEMAASAQGILSDGVLKNTGMNLSLQELNLNFDYEYNYNTIELNDIQGTVLVGNPNHVEEYFFAGDSFRFTEDPQKEGQFDFWLGDKKRDIIRLAGKTRSSFHEGKSTIDFLLDHQLTHFGDVHPSTFQLTLNDWTQVETFHLDFNVKFNSLLHDLQRFSRTGLLFLSRQFLKELNALKKAEGNFKVALNYDRSHSFFSYNASGKNLEIGKYQFQDLSLNGKKKDSVWIIDQLQLDNLSLAADFIPSQDEWKINFLGARVGNSILVGLEGKYLCDQSIFQSQVNLLEIDLARLHEWPSLEEWIKKYQPAGLVRGIGQMTLEFNKGSPGFRLESILNLSLRSCAVNGLNFKDCEEISCNFSSESGIKIQNIKTALKSSQDNSLKSQIHLEACKYDSINHEFLVDSLHFKAPAENLRWLTETLQQKFPEVITQNVASVIQESKKKGNLEGSLKLEISNPHCALRLSLKDGVYSYLNKDHDLSHFILDYDPFELKVVTQYRYDRHLFWLMGKSTAVNFEHGELLLSDVSFDHGQTPQRRQQPLTIAWQMDPTYGFTMNKVRGTFAGLTFDLGRDPEMPLVNEFLSLNGVLKMDLAKAKVLLSEELSKKITEFEFGNGYQMKGKWRIGKDDRKDFVEQIYFQGELEGRNFELLGYNLQKLQAQLTLSPIEVQMHNVSIADPSGNLYIEKGNLYKLVEKDWLFQIPSLVITDFRPSMLHLEGITSPTSAKALVIRQVDIQDFMGIMGLKESFRGKGQLVFGNAAKKNQHNILFAIPGEILSRIGLDLRVLNPVTGTIFYEIKKGKIYLTRFKDVYSEGRLSKFYLPNNNYESYMDFNGNLHFQVKMKQYNLLFKLAELFTVTIQGNLKKPSYSLQKQNRHQRDPKDVVLDSK